MPLSSCPGCLPCLLLPAGTGPDALGWSFLPAPRLELGSVEVYQGRPAAPAHSASLISLYLLEKTLSLPVIEEHRKEGGRKGDKQIELGTLPPVKAWIIGRGGSCPFLLGSQALSPPSCPYGPWAELRQGFRSRPGTGLCFSPRERGLDWAIHIQHDLG